MWSHIGYRSSVGQGKFVLPCLFSSSKDKNSSGDEIANVLVNDDIAHT